VQTSSHRFLEPRPRSQPAWQIQWSRILKRTCMDPDQMVSQSPLFVTTLQRRAIPFWTIIIDLTHLRRVSIRAPWPDCVNNGQLRFNHGSNRQFGHSKAVSDIRRGVQAIAGVKGLDRGLFAPLTSYPGPKPILEVSSSSSSIKILPATVRADELIWKTLGQGLRVAAMRPY